jgi:hypothetical protein
VTDRDGWLGWGGVVALAVLAVVSLGLACWL